MYIYTHDINRTKLKLLRKAVKAAPAQSLQPLNDPLVMVETCFEPFRFKWDRRRYNYACALCFALGDVIP